MSARTGVRDSEWLVTEPILGIVTGGPGDARRLRTLADALPFEMVVEEIDRSLPRRESARSVRRALTSRPWPLVIQEGTGLAGGLNLIRLARESRTPYVVSSGDPVGGFFRTVKGPLAGALFERYERALYRHSVGYVGWSPYLTGMALKMGAPRGATVEGGVNLRQFRAPSERERADARAALGLDPTHLVCGVVGSLNWTPRQQYCYGLELVGALPHLRRQDVSVVIVGDGDGRPRLEAIIPPALRSRVVFTGRLPAEKVPGVLHAFDVGFITQTLDGLGSYRLTTKLPEYLASEVPVAMSPVPGYFDYVDAAGWPLPGGHPADPAYHAALAVWLDGLGHDDVERRRPLARRVAEARFDYDALGRRFASFIGDVLTHVKA
jgi:glycosyltransferase involved in cell wall biosynthesis